MDGVLRDFLSQFDKQYRRVFINNPSIVNMNNEFEYRQPSEYELDEEAKRIEDIIKSRITLPVNTNDLLNHYQFDEVVEEFKDYSEDLIKIGEDGMMAGNEKMVMPKGDGILTDRKTYSPQEALNRFIYELYPFQLFGDAEAYTNSSSYFNQIQAFGLQEGLFETVILPIGKSTMITATYYFLHKTGNRGRSIQFVENDYDKWNYCDILVDAAPEALQNKPNGKVSIKIEREYNQWDSADYSLSSLKELKSPDFLRKLFA